MSSDSNPLEPAPTRRSRRAPATPETLSTGPALAAEPPLTRAEFRRRAADAAARAAAPQDGAPGDGGAVSEPQDISAPNAPAPVAELVERSPSSRGLDEFARAAHAFSFTGEPPAEPGRPAAAPREDSTREDFAKAVTGTARVASRRRRVGSGLAFKRLAAASFSVGVMGVVGLLAVGMTTPVSAVAVAKGGTAAVSITAPAVEEPDEPVQEIQAYVASADVEHVDLLRSENYSAVTTAQLAYESGIVNVSNLFVNDQNGEIQWPFAVGVPMTWGYGYRDGRLHEGIDFVPGAGAPIQAITDGTVRVASEAGGAYGVHVIVDHVVDGQLISSHYAHMQYGSLQVSVGDTVTAGTVVGLTGNTGRSYGAHLHFELLVNGTTSIDPLPWLREHAGG